RLRAEGTTFSAVLTQLRHDLARPLLRDGRLAVAEVAFLLGYEDPNAFHRAFRRWFRLSPRAFLPASGLGVCRLRPKTFRRRPSCTIGADTTLRQGLESAGRWGGAARVAHGLRCPRSVDLTVVLSM